ncbi:hypothetical protein QJS04_geneDACA003369 [Acorus gramineus]|uniref:Uncharacterized protein n=1 Tax=Acorus gramineus TaxID=55184 RepID=A0AAV9BKR5_ACOGR|nr:hypothetical protein QJS04_geneDACA003369 [Acorus gramineus]
MCVSEPQSACHHPPACTTSDCRSPLPAPTAIALRQSSVTSHQLRSPPPSDPPPPATNSDRPLPAILYRHRPLLCHLRRFSGCPWRSSDHSRPSPATLRCSPLLLAALRRPPMHPAALLSSGGHLGISKH